MKNIKIPSFVQLVALMLMMLPSVLIANDNKKFAVALLDKAVEKLKSDAGVQIDFVLEQTDSSDGDILATDNGSIYIDNSKDTMGIERFSLQMKQLKIWCNGERQWNYMTQTNEIYLTTAKSEEAQSLSPIYLMQLYKTGEYDCSVETYSGNCIVTLASSEENSEYNEVIVYISAKTLQLVKISLVDREQNCTSIKVKNYKSGCTFDNTLFECPIGEFPDAEVIDMM